MTKSKEPAGETVGVRIPTDVHHRAKVYAAEKKLDLWRVIAAAVDEYVKKKRA